MIRFGEDFGENLVSWRYLGTATIEPGSLSVHGRGNRRS